MQSLKGRSLSFRQSWFDSFSWLHYKASASGVVCFYCEKAEHLGLFQLSRNREDAFITTGFRNWKKALQRFQEHAQSRSHQFAVERVAHHHAAQPVDSQLSTQRDAEQREARCCLEIIFTSIQYLARQGLALRGHTEDEGNFKQLLLLRCTDKPAMQRWLDRKTALTSPQAQNEILQLMANTIVKSIADKVAEAKQYAVIVDGTQDASRKEQLAMCLRYVDEHFIPHEEFVGMYEPPNTTGATIARCIQDVLLRLNLPTSMLRGQTYDGASNMSGQYRGCQAIIAEQQPLALYVHCGAHSVNLVSQSVSDACPTVRDALQVVNELGVLFNSSITARSTFSKIADSDEGPVKQPRPLCPTRWLVRVKAVQTVTSQYDAVLQCLEELGAPGSPLAARASGLQHQLGRGNTLLALEMALHVFTPLESLNRALQSSYQTVGGMIDAVSEVKTELTAMRTDAAFAALLDGVIQRQQTMDLVPVDVPRQRRPPRRFTGPAPSCTATSVSDHYRPIYFSLLDNAVEQLTERFSGAGLTRYKQLEDVLVTGEVPDEMRQYPELNVLDLAAQLRMFRRTRQVTSVESAATALRDMVAEVRSEYEQVDQLVRLLMVSPASSAQAERSFSALRRLKTWLRTSMSEVRLNSVAVCHTHQQLMDCLEMQPLVSEFVSRSDLRRLLFGCNDMD